MITGMDLSASSKIVKYLMFIFNLLFVITGIVLLTFGFVVYKFYNNFEYLLDTKFFSVPTLLVIVGFTIFLIAFFGCCGAVRENRFMILTFTTLMALIFILEVVAGILGYVLKADATVIVEQNMNATMHRYPSGQLPIQFMWNQMQTNLQCCGTTKPTDWVDILHSTNLPLSCCKSMEIGTTNCTLSSKFLNKEGCLTKVVDTVQSHTLQLGIVCTVIVFIQVIGIWLSIHLARDLYRNNYETV